MILSTSKTFTLVIEFHKVEATVGHGNGWAAD